MAESHGLLTPFIFPELSVRGALVQVVDGWQEWHQRRHYPETVAGLLGQAMAAAPLLAASLKFEGKLSLQAQGDGAVSLLLVQANDELEVRGMARFHGEIGGAPNPSLFGKGRLGLILEPAREGQRYEALVPLEGADLGACLASYFSQSEQLETRVQLAADARRLAGIMLQRMPAGAEDDADGDAWPRLTALLATIEETELLELSPETLLRRLFHEESVVLFEQRAVQLYCRCSHARTSELLLSLGEAEVRNIVAEQGQVEMDCGFCGAQYVYLPSDVEQLFSADQAIPETDLRH